MARLEVGATRSGRSRPEIVIEQLGPQIANITIFDYHEL
jgi:hypothetical protein